LLPACLNVTIEVMCGRDVLGVVSAVSVCT
jgi:hypothetical protein